MGKALPIFGWLLAVIVALASTRASAQGANDPGPAVYAADAPGVVRIHAVGVKSDDTMDGNDGTGFIISQSGYILTASHVVPDEKAYKTLLLGGYIGPATGSGKPYQLKLIGRSDKYDAALLQFVDPHPSLAVLPLRTTPPTVGELLFVLGYPLGLPDAHLLDGRVGAIADDALTTNALVDRGNSGGPVVDAHGCVLGIVFGGIESLENQPVNGFKFAVPVKSLSDFLPNDTKATKGGGRTSQEPDTIHVTDTLSRMQTDHALLNDTTRAYHDVIPARAGFVIEAIEAVGKNSLNPPELQFPTPMINAGGASMSFDYSLVSGPQFDQRRGWIDMTISTRQRRNGAASVGTTLDCP